MNCADVMKKDVEFVSPNDTVQSAAKKMADFNVGFLPVLDNNHKAIGTLTDRDIAIRLASSDKSASGTKISDVMSRDIISCKEDDDLEEAERLMSDNKKSRMLVCDDDGKLCGVISLSDLPRAAGQGAFDTMKQVSEREVHTH